MMRKLLIGIGLVAALSIVVYLLIPNDMGLRLFWAQLANVREIATPPADLLAAKTIWDANPIKHYKLHIHYDRSIYPFVSCLIEVEVFNEIIVATPENSCGHENGDRQLRFAPLGSTVTDLLAKFQTQTTTIHFNEDQSCGEFMIVAITYAKAGYPTSAKYSWEQVSPWNLGPNTYKSMYGDGPRTMTCFGGADKRQPDITIDLQPLP